MTRPDSDESPPQPPGEAPATPERFPELAELEETIRRRLRSNQRFLERFLDDEFVDDEMPEEDDNDAAGEEEL
jgi:hypothetical protein